MHTVRSYMEFDAYSQQLQPRHVVIGENGSRVEPVQGAQYPLNYDKGQRAAALDCAAHLNGLGVGA